MLDLSKMSIGEVERQSNIMHNFTVGQSRNIEVLIVTFVILGKWRKADSSTVAPKPFDGKAELTDSEDTDSNEKAQAPAENERRAEVFRPQSESESEDEDENGDEGEVEEDDEQPVSLLLIFYTHSNSMIQSTTSIRSDNTEKEHVADIEMADSTVEKALSSTMSDIDMNPSTDNIAPVKITPTRADDNNSPIDNVAPVKGTTPAPAADDSIDDDLIDDDPIDDTPIDDTFIDSTPIDDNSTPIDGTLINNTLIDGISSSEMTAAQCIDATDENPEKNSENEDGDPTESEVEETELLSLDWDEVDTFCWWPELVELFGAAKQVKKWAFVNWVRLINAFLVFKRKLFYQDDHKHILAGKGRPPVIATFMKNRRQWRKSWDVEPVDMYGLAWWYWWKSLQPAMRFVDETLVKMDELVWDGLEMFSGRNGLVLVIGNLL